MKILYKIERAIYNIEFAAIIVLLLSLCVFAFTQVVLRLFFSMPIVWLAVYNNIALLVLALLGASIATSSFERSHININLFQSILKFPYDKYLSTFLSLTASAACMMFFIFSAHFVSVVRQVGKIEHAINTPEWVIVLIFPICFLSMSYKFCVCFLKDLTDLINKRRSEDTAENTIR